MKIAKICKVEDCNTYPRFGEICDVHRYRMKKFNSYDKPSRKKYGELCKVDECERLRDGRHSVCGTHRIRWERYKSYDVPTIEYPNGIVHTCKKHGELTEETAYKNPKTGHYSCAPCRRIADKRYADNNKNKNLNAYKKHYYVGKGRIKLSIEHYNLMLSIQNDVCAICKKAETCINTKKRSVEVIKRLAIDHKHDETQKIRGLLCQTCNIGLGSFKDSIEYLQSAIDYLKAHQ